MWPQSVSSLCSNHSFSVIILVLFLHMPQQLCNNIFQWPFILFILLIRIGMRDNQFFVEFELWWKIVVKWSPDLETLSSHILFCNKIRKVEWPALWTGSSVHLMDACCMSTAHHLDQNWSIINMLRPRQNGQHSAGDILKLIFLDENYCILIQISLKFVPNDPINNKHWFR